VKRTVVIIFSLIVFACPEYCQELTRSEGLILFHGLVMDAGTQSPLANSQILINRRFSSVSDKEGKFTFYVNRSDTVVFSMLGYKPEQLIISDTLSGREFIVGIYLNADTLSIGEVIIMPRLRNLKTEILKPRSEPDVVEEYAKYNVALSAYQGRMGQNRLGDPISNYEILRQKQIADAYSKGQIPSDRMIGLSPFLLIPAAYLLMNGLPPKPSSYKPQLSIQEIDQIHRKYLETLKQRE
jgi:hypothetical protein